jgi:hypothetical protein
MTYLCHNNKDRIVYVSADRLPNHGFPIEQNSILLAFIIERHRDPFLHSTDYDSSNGDADCENAFINPEQSPVWTRIDGVPHLDNCLARSQSVTSILISSTMQLLYGHYVLIRRSID